jgi:hypothetical protein
MFARLPAAPSRRIAPAANRRRPASLLAGEQVAKTLQLGIEYYLSPPFPESSALEGAPEIQQRIRSFESTGAHADEDYRAVQGFVRGRAGLTAQVPPDRRERFRAESCRRPSR